MSVTRKQVAKHAGVSEATVSYVVNNGPRPVASATRERVLEAIQTLGYHPSDVARSLRMQRTSTFGLIVPDTANPFYGEIARTIENAGYKNGYTALLCNSNSDPAREVNYINTLRSKRVAGVVIIPTAPDSIAHLMEGDIPTVVLEYEIPGAYCLVADDFGGGAAVAHHLIELGHDRIACIVKAGDASSSQKRVEGYKQMLRWTGRPINNALILPVPHPVNGVLPKAMTDIECGKQAALVLLRLPFPPTAIIAHNDAMALGVMAGVRELGLRTPGDVSVAGFDDIAEAAYFDPPLTTVATPKQAMGKQAARLLIDLMKGENKQSSSPRIMTFETSLVVRRSTAPPGKTVP